MRNRGRKCAWNVRYLAEIGIAIIAAEIARDVRTCYSRWMEMADKAAAFLVKSFEVIGNRRGGTKERKEKRIENGNEIRGGGGGEERSLV